MSAVNSVVDDAADSMQAPAPVKRGIRRSVLFAAILLVASLLRLVHLGQSSLWYDEVVTMRLARTQSPGALFALLRQIDATRAPLHPLVLQSWVAFFGPGDYPARMFSCLCGIITVALVYWIGLRAFDTATALWAAWLSALSPLLIYYSREVRMYAWLVTVTSLSWGAIFSQERAPGYRWLVLYGLCLIALAYSHPLGLLMAGSLGLATLLNRRAFRISWRAWLLTHLTAGLAVLPWLSQYLGHAPELITGPLPLRFLLGTPIGFIGGNFVVLLVCMLLIGWGLYSVKMRDDGSPHGELEHPVSAVALLIWLAVPPLALYLYSLVVHPIFGPARYTLFVGPAYLILVARGLGKLPLPVGILAAAAGAFLSSAMLRSDVYRHDLKADWRAAAAYLDRHDPNALVVVISADPAKNTEIETARYYLGLSRIVIRWPVESDFLTRTGNRVWVTIGLRDGRAVGMPGTMLSTDERVREVVDFPGLRLMRVSLRTRGDDGTPEGLIQGLLTPVATAIRM